jgi:hypothetical protein
MGNPLGNWSNINELVKKADNINRDEKHEYTRFARIKTSSHEDELMKVKAAKAASLIKCKLVGQSCLIFKKQHMRAWLVVDWVDLNLLTTRLMRL